MTRFDWPELLRAGLCRLGLQPGQFWALTPVELTMMLGQGNGVVALDRDRLEHLMHAYPDQTGDTENG